MKSIDLAEIESLIKTLNNGVKQCKSNGEPLDRADWLHQIGVLVSANKAKQIAEALEALPKLVAVLDQIEGAPQPFNAFEYGSFVETAKQLASEALAPFQSPTKIQQNG